MTGCWAPVGVLAVLGGMLAWSLTHELVFIALGVTALVVCIVRADATNRDR